MRVRIDGDVLTGRTLDLRERNLDDLDAVAMADAVRGDDRSEIAVECPAPDPVHEHVGAIRPEMSLSLRPALAAAARSRGHAAPRDDELAAVRERLADIEPAEIDLADARRRVADASDEQAATRERVAALRGRVQARRESGDDPADAEAELAEATRRLSEVETERIAAEQALARARERARENRERRRERLRLADRADNLRRSAREHLAGAVREAFAEAREAVPGDPAERTEAALAVARVAEFDAPVVISAECDLFESPKAASQWIDAPVVRV